MTGPRRPALAWPPAVMVSFGAHILAAMVLVETIAPDPVTFSDAVKSSFSVATVSVPSRRAEESEADTETAATATATGERLGVQAIPRGRARPIDPQTTVAPALRPEGQALSSTPAPAVVAVALNQERRVEASGLPAERLAAASPAAAPIIGAEAEVTGIIPTATETVTVVARRPESVSLGGVSGATDRLGAALPQSPDIRATVPDDEPQVAAAIQGLPVRPNERVRDRATTRLAAAEHGGDAVRGDTPRGDNVAPKTAAVELVVTSQPETAETAPAGGRGESIGATAAVGAAVVAAAVPTKVVPAVDAAPPLVETGDLPATEVAAAIAPATAARRASPPSVSLTEASTVGEDIAAARPDDTVLASAEGGAALVSGSAATGVEVGSAAPQPQVAAAVADTGTLVETEAPEAARVEAAGAFAPVVAGDTPRGDGIDAAPPEADSVAGLIPAGFAADETELGILAASIGPQDVAAAAARTEARQAWAGNINKGLDEQSLAAIQSFMQPADAAKSEVREGIGSALARFPCSRLQAAFVPETGGLEVRGHIPIPQLRGLVVGLLEQSVGASIPVSGSLMILPPPQCGVLEAVEGLGLPQSDEQQNDPLVVGEEAQADILQFEDGMRVSFQLKAAEYDSYMYVDFYDPEGIVQHILPNERMRQIRRPPNARFVVGRGGADDVEMFAAAPFGQDIAVVLAATRPLYEGLRPPVEPAADYLAWLQARIRVLRQEDPAFRGEWAYLFVTTGPEGSFSQP